MELPKRKGTRLKYYDYSTPGVYFITVCVKDRKELLRCILCTLNSSGVTLKSNVEILIYGDAKDIPLYEYRDMFHTISRR